MAIYGRMLLNINMMTPTNYKVVGFSEIKAEKPLEL
jgi:hypothetical protein